MDIRFLFKNSPQNPQNAPHHQLSCFASPSQMDLTTAVPSDPTMETGRARLLPVPPIEMEFINQNEDGQLGWKEVAKQFDRSDYSQCIDIHGVVEGSSPKTAENDLHASAELHQASDSGFRPPKIRIALEASGRYFHDRITEEEIKQAILYTASLNKLSLSQDEACECARLIREELDADQGAVESTGDNLSKTSPKPGTPASYPSHPKQSEITVLFRAHWRHGAAETLKLNMALVLLPISRNTMTWLRKRRWINSTIPFNDTINFHKLIAGGIVIGVILHAGTHLACDFPRIVNAKRSVFRRTIAKGFHYRQPSYLEILGTTEGATGIAMVVLMVIAFLLATRPSRRQHISLPWPIRRFAGFNAFWYSHHLLALVYVLLIIHSMFLFLTKDATEKTTWMYLAIPVLIYAGERVFRIIRSGIYDVQILKATIYSGEVLSLKLQKPAGFQYCSGMYIFVQCPQISTFEWHPFSLTSAPGDDHLSLHIRSLGDWSYQIYSLFQEALVSGRANFPKICIDGPYGAASQDHCKYDNILLIGLGIGATPFISILKDIAGSQKGPQLDTVNDVEARNVEGPIKAYFYWVTREQGSFEWFRDIMKEVSIVNRKKGVIEMHNYLTSVFQEGDKRSALISAIQALHFMKSGVDIISKTPVWTQFARPNWFKVFSGLATRHGGERIGKKP
ncbi:respiratory burst oxidase-like protein F [Cocos nucifera]|uniref:Respiratory burst oxidase-like protein F n=1 Tax=Cocos nucifera TaxID=13894 RepID=A0A8K0ISZ6_COCNU|nr:respiratory burst oxidase-like protein F [Cocos nucifera]